jgi:hypothetical protein
MFEGVESWWDNFHPLSDAKNWATRKALGWAGVPDSVADMVAGGDKDKSKEASVSIIDQIKNKFESIMGGDKKPDENKPDPNKPAGEDKSWFGGLFKDMSMGKGLLMAGAAAFGLWLLVKNVFGDDEEEKKAKKDAENEEEENKKKKKKEKDADNDDGASLGSVLWAGIKSALAAVAVSMVAKFAGAKGSSTDIMEAATTGFLTGAFANATTGGREGGITTGVASVFNTVAADALADKLGVQSPLAKMFMRVGLGEIEAVGIDFLGKKTGTSLPKLPSLLSAPAPAHA